MKAFKEFRLASMNRSEVYGLLTSSTVPRPIALVTSLNTTNGIVNCAPFSYFNVMSHDPPILSLGICTKGRARTKKDTLVNIEASGELVVNIISESFVEAANQTSGDYSSDCSEIEAAGLQTIPSLHVSPPRVLSSSIHYECKVHALHPLHNDEGHHTATIVLARVLAIHVHEDVLDKNKEGVAVPSVNILQLRPVARAGDNIYTTVGSILAIDRPKITSN